MNFFKKDKITFPPVPEWKPSFNSDIQEVIDIFKYYSSGKKDFVVFKNLTMAIIEDGLNDEKATEQALNILNKVYNFHPDMTPQNMDDGNILISYRHPAYNIVIEKTVQKHWKEIEKNYLKALCTSEVIITPLGQNKFDDFGKKSLWGRCYFFMDAQNPEVVKIVRKNS